ncbi:APO protein 1, chloroplastic [Cucumis melo]|uniref:APO protein 1, chloroplastic n=1 Tax=Cucumis melo TaxID=3656 RepID=A0A1S3CM36_CUCME|nr:APO protein 1, chloroplastic [Cucumis melo]
MLQMLPAVSTCFWDPSQMGILIGNVEFTSRHLSALRSYTLRPKFAHKLLSQKVPTALRTLSYTSQEYGKEPVSKKRDVYRQNVDLPAILPKKKKKPYPIPIKQIKRAAKADKELAQRGIEKPLEPGKNGLLVPDLIPVAHQVLDAWKILIKGLSHLLHVIPVYACRECSEVHVAHSGHHIQDCLGSTSAMRRSFHSWVTGSINDVLVPIESYHLYDPFGRRIKHETRFEYDRIPAVVELCIQAGVDIPEYPSRRRTKPIRMIGKKVIDRGGNMEEPKPWQSCESYPLLDFDTQGASQRFAPPLPDDVPRIAQETIEAYETVRYGVRMLMKKYTVKACGYCPEVHVGPWGHNAKLCGEFKHQWRDGKHGWQDATLDEVLPRNYVWHVRDPKGPPLIGTLKRFYGKAPAVVEVCMQAGATIPKKYLPMMRLDIVLPDGEEARSVA